MSTIRLSIVIPQPGHRAEVERLLDYLEDLLQTKSGWVLGGRFEATDGSGEIGRLGVWDSEHDADAAAMDDDVIAVRSQIHMLVQPGHLERLYRYLGHGELTGIASK